MGIFFSGRELIEIAIGIEKNGAIFYGSLAGSSKNHAARDIYKYLADQEKEHAAIFQKMLDSVGESKPPETYTEQYNLYLKALIDSLFFVDDEVSRKMAQNVKSEAEAIQIGIGAEKDSILFYVEVKDVIRRSDRKAVGKIIEEERSHLRQLTEIKKSL
ncbi:MAG TPA: ferritin family protein [Dehalococcoidia bacterium]|nr:ferritin family protein [Dehalococcoidia bacterium]